MSDFEKALDRLRKKAEIIFKSFGVLPVITPLYGKVNDDGKENCSEK